ncbi:unnamed protein product [Microthlaspi erraticum]|uniref:Methyltransferase n=1 Tax=Microthlaspi erraticum TaxID=1685480 RepID=A0A6D2KNH5_9BRAS|nr:unnamed protein product [Microthlaspi erraticum]
MSIDSVIRTQQHKSEKFKTRAKLFAVNFRENFTSIKSTGRSNRKCPSRWPERLTKQSSEESYREDTRIWSGTVSEIYLNGLGINWTRIHNVMDMNAGYGGFAAALINRPLWVMNVVPVKCEDKLSMIFDRERSFGTDVFMAPKTEVMKAVEALQRDVERIEVLEKSIEEMRQQMGKLSVLDRLERHLDEVDRSKQKAEEIVIGSVKLSSTGKQREEDDPGSATVVDQNVSSLLHTTTEVVTAKLEGDTVVTVSGEPAKKDRNEPLTRKIEIPVFDGENAESWVLRVEQYFEMGDFSEEEKLRAVRMCFDEDALLWYRWERERNPFVSWDQLKRRVLVQFSDDFKSSAGEQLMTLRQDGSVKDYCKEFIAIATNAPGLAEDVLEMAFRIGLNPRILAGMKMLNPRGLEKMMSAARRVEEWDEAEDFRSGPLRGGAEKWSRNSSGRFAAANPKPSSHPGQGGKAPPHNRLKPPFRRLTPAELAKWKAEGLCFKCDEKFVYPHQCAKRELMVLLVLEDGSEELLTCDWEEDPALEMMEIAELSLNSIAGISSPHTIKLIGTIEGEPVVVMIDSGTSHNFVSESMLGRLGLVPETIGGYGVRTGGGITVKGKGVCRNVKLEMQGCRVITSLLPLSLGTADVILGCQWLETLGDT